MKTIDLSTWKRAQHYQFFHRMDYPQYNICMNVDITNFLKKTKEKHLPFYHSMIYASSLAANEIEEFRYRIRKEEIVLHDRVHPSFTEMSQETELFKFVTVSLENTLEEFIAAAKAKAASQTEYFPLKELAGRDDLLYITCIPWISFTSISHTINVNRDDSAVRLSWGKYFSEGEKVLLPFSVQVNHALVDGYHVGKYVEVLQSYLDSYN